MNCDSTHHQFYPGCALGRILADHFIKFGRPSNLIKYCKMRLRAHLAGQFCRLSPKLQPFFLLSRPKWLLVTSCTLLLLFVSRFLSRKLVENQLYSATAKHFLDICCSWFEHVVTTLPQSGWYLLDVDLSLLVSNGTLFAREAIFGRAAPKKSGAV